MLSRIKLIEDVCVGKGGSYRAGLVGVRRRHGSRGPQSSRES